MGKRKSQQKSQCKMFQCKICGAVLKGMPARREHCQEHHPDTSRYGLDVYFPTEYKEISSNEETTRSDKSVKSAKPQKTKSVKPEIITNAPKKEVDHIDTSFDCSKIIPIKVPRIPRSSSAEHLFEFAVKRVAELHKGKPSLLDTNTTAQWSNICFGYPGLKNHERQQYMLRIKDKFGAYFKRGGLKYSFDFGQILRDFPQYFKGGEGHKSTKNVSLDALIAAVRTEINLSQQPNNRLKYKVKKIERLDSAKYLYQLQLDLNDDDMPSFYDGISITLKVGDSFYNCEGIDYDSTVEILTIRSQRSILGRSGTIYLDTTFILKALSDKLSELRCKGFATKQPGSKFIPDNTRNLSTVQAVKDKYLPIVKNLDSFQQTAHNASIKNDISFIWGPPGTGKSFTLAALINSFYRDNSPTLVCCISNVAVDQLLNKVVDVVQDLNLRPQPGQLLRSGHTIDPRLIQLDYLFPSDSNTRSIRERISELTQKIASPLYDAKTKALLKEQRIDLRDELKKRVETLIGSSTIVFSTIANYVLSKSLAGKKFDNLIVDEASMISLPYLLAIGANIAKRIILVGDPNQLGPIAINPDRLLRDSVFDYCNVFNSNTEHPALHQLLTQRRSHTSIVNITNNAFYDGRLKPVINKSPDWVNNSPLRGRVIKVINSNIENNIVKPIGSSRRNFGTCDAVMHLLHKYYIYCLKSGQNISIGIITPYRAQVRLYYAKVREAYGDSVFFKNIKIGTIHTFQGSECDIVFFDLVEESSFPVSRLLNDKDGERLITVALTRARHQLIVVGDTDRFGFARGTASVSNKLCHVLRTLSDVK